MRLGSLFPSPGQRCCDACPRDARGRSARRAPNLPAVSRPYTWVCCRSAPRRVGRSQPRCTARLREQCVPRAPAPRCARSDLMTVFPCAASADFAGFADDMLTFDSDSDMLTDFDDEVRCSRCRCRARAGGRGHMTSPHDVLRSGRRRRLCRFRRRTSTSRWRSEWKLRPASPSRSPPAPSSATSGGQTLCPCLCA